MRTSNNRFSLFVGFVSIMAILFEPPTIEANKKEVTPEYLYEHGKKLLKRGYYDKAIENFEKVKNHFPFSEYAPLAELRIADCYFEKGEYPSSADLYLAFLKLHPDHNEADYAAYRVGLSYDKEASSIAARDQSYTAKMVSFLKDFSKTYPNSKYRAQVKELYIKGRNKLAKKELIIGKYYFKRGVYKAAIARFEGLLKEFSETKYVDLARLYLARSYCKIGVSSRAQEIFKELKTSTTSKRMKKRVDKYSKLCGRYEGEKEKECDE